MRFRRMWVLWMVAFAVAGCERGRGVPQHFAVTTPHETYAALLHQTGLHSTALGRDWLAAAAAAVERSSSVTLPHRELRFLDPSAASVASYRVSLERGQRFRVDIALSDDPADSTLVFLDVFTVTPASLPARLVASADSLAHRLEYVALQSGDYVLRVQPELLRGGRVLVTLSTHASLDFPVTGRDMGAIRSRFGAPRDGGRREHHGVDIFARRGTPVIASVAGRARAATNRLGGNVVWLRDAGFPRSLYYAHLDRHAFDGTRQVEPGDTLGFVGNSGNARTTPPHLHFGIYMRRIGAVDPDPHLYEPRTAPPDFVGDRATVGSLARTAGRTTLHAAPSPRGARLADVDAATPLQIVAGVGAWYRATLPDGTQGFVMEEAVEMLQAPVGSARLTRATTIADAPGMVALPRESVAAGVDVPILGRFGSFVFVRAPTGTRGWVPTTALRSLSATSADAPQ